MLLMLATLAHASADADPQPYAVFDNGTLTFYCDNQKATHSGAMDLNEGHTFPEWYQYASEITTVEFDPMFKNASPTSCCKWFTEFANLTEIKGIQYLNTSEVSDMSGMFEGCKALKSLDLSSFNTENVTSMSSMFSYSSALKTILVGSGWNVNEETFSDDMFSGCEMLTGGNGTTYQADKTDKTYAVIDGKDGKDGYLTSLDQVKPYAVFDSQTGTLTFYDDKQLRAGAMPLNEGDADPEWIRYASIITTVEFTESFQYARPKTCYFWFPGCSNLTEIKGIQHLNTSEVTDMSYMFRSCSALESLDLSSFNTEKVRDMGNMFSYCSALESLDLSSFNTSGVEWMANMFLGCSALESLDLSSFNTASVTDMKYMFYGCSALKTILVGSGWNVDKVTDSDNMFTGCANLIGGNGTKYTDDNLDRILQVSRSKSDQFYCDIYVDNTVVSPLPVYSIPGIATL